MIKSVLAGEQPALIIADALADMIGMLDEDKAQHITQVYKNLRRLEQATGSAIFVLHHEGWSKGRERGSTAIRAKGDIVPRIVKFNPEEGYVEFEHLKRRGGAKLKKFRYELKLVRVEGCEQPVPIVTGKMSSVDVDYELNRNFTADEEGARKLVRILV